MRTRSSLARAEKVRRAAFAISAHPVSGAVYRVTRSDGQAFVLKKRLCVDLSDANSALKEAVGLAKYSSHYIVKYEDVYLESVRVSQAPPLAHVFCGT